MSRNRSNEPLTRGGVLNIEVQSRISSLGIQAHTVDILWSTMNSKNNPGQRRSDRKKKTPKGLSRFMVANTGYTQN